MYKALAHFESRFIYPSLCRVLNRIWSMSSGDRRQDALVCPSSTYIGDDYVGMEVFP